MTSLEGWGSAIELRPRGGGRSPATWVAYRFPPAPAPTAVATPAAPPATANPGTPGQNDGTTPTGPVSGSTVVHGTGTGDAGSSALSMSARATGS